MLRTPNALLWTLLRPLLRLILRLKLRFRAPFARMKEPFVLLCNYASYYDPLLAAVSVNRPLRFCGAEAAPRAGLLLSLARRLRQPETLDWREAIAEAGEKGLCVGLFPEGRRTSDGATGPLPAELGEALLESGLGLVVLRLTGSYLTAPRWADSIPRPGRIRARVMRTLTPGVLQAMEPDELQSMLEHDLHEDAFESVRRWPAAYRGERNAERLEKLLCVCPKCGAFGTMESRDNELICRSCGFTTVYTLSGSFRGGNVPFADPGQWARWQVERIRMRCEAAGEGAIFEDGGYEIYDLRSGSDRIGSGGLHLYRDRLELPTGIALPLADIVSLRLIGGSGLRLESRKGSVFDMKTIRPICAEKYITALDILRGEPAEEETITEQEPEPGQEPEPAFTGEAEEDEQDRI